MFPPSEVLPEVDASHWAMGFPRVCEDARQLVGLVFVHLLQIFFTEELECSPGLVNMQTLMRNYK